jgi:aspartyl-tRNA(Asn)/glutamyl-tRNA(Gln) amidotransferase subunit A
MTAGRDFRSIADTAPLIRAGSVGPVELVNACLAQIDGRRHTNAFITVMREQAVADAQRMTSEIAAGRYLGPLHGIPLSIKDLVDVAGTPTTSGSRVPARRPVRDAPLVSRLREAGAIIIGKTNLHEFAFGTTSDETAFGPVHHPRDNSRSAGGSSGGSAAAIVDGMCYASVGTDTGGSIRIPAAACGIVGLKAGFGEISCEGVVPLSTSLDHAGPMARTVVDAALLYQAMTGAGLYEIAPAGGRLVFGVPRPYFFDRLEPGTRAVIDAAIGRLAESGYSVRDVAIAHAEWTADVYLHIVLPEAACFHAPLLAEHADKYSPGVRLRLEMGRYVLAEDYVRAMRMRDVLTKAVDTALDRCDALLLPALPIPAPRLGASTVDVDGTQQPVRATMLRLTQLFNLTGHPAIAIPAGRGPEGLPRSLEIVGHRGRTERLLDVAAAVERAIR